MVWSIEQELCSVADDPDLMSALARLGLHRSSQPAPAFEPLQGWAARGSESYTYVFRLLAKDDTKDLIFKAFTPPIGQCTVQEALDRHMRSDEQLRAAGVRTAHTYGAGGGVVLMDYIPRSLYELQGAQLSAALVASAVDIANGVARADFDAVDGHLDLRTDGEAVFLVDLGTYLRYRAGASASATIRRLTDRLRLQGADV